MTEDINQEVDFSVMDANEWNKTDQKINQIKNILKEEGLEDDPELLEAFDQAIQAAIKGDSWE